MYRNCVRFFLLCIVFASCSDKSGRSRLEHISGLKLPAELDVIKDEYVDTGKDFGLKYEVRLKPGDISAFTSQIRASKRYKKTGFSDNGVWQLSGMGYSFYLAKGGAYYTIDLDTISRILVYHEQG